MLKVTNMKRRWQAAGGLCGGLIWLVGCAHLPSSHRRDGEGVEPTAAGGSPTDVLKAGPKQPEARVSEDARADFEKAVAVYQKLKRNGPLKGSDCDEAASAFRRVADDNPALLIARHNEASVYMECGNKSQATRIEEELARKNYAPALANLGYAAMISGDNGQAESYFTRSIQADPQAASIAARINLSQIILERARRAGSVGERQRIIKDALTHLRAVLALDGNSLQAYATMCFIYYTLDLPDAVVLIGTQAIKRAEEIATGKFEDESVAQVVDREKEQRAAKGKKAKKEEKGEEAATRTARASGQGTGWTPDMKKHVAVVHNTLGLVSLSKKSYKDAIPSFKKAVELDPELYEARMNLAAVSLRFRDYNTAEEQFRAVVGAQPRNYAAVIGLGVALRGNRKYDEAESQYLAAQKIDPSQPDSYFNLGLLYQEYKGSERPTLEKAQAYYRDFLSRTASGPMGSRMRRDAEKRIKDIDELFVALAEAKKLQEEAERIQREAEIQQKKMEEQLKRQEEDEKKKGGAATPATEPGPSPTAPPPSTSSSTTRPPASSAAVTN